MIEICHFCFKAGKACSWSIFSHFTFPTKFSKISLHLLCYFKVRLKKNRKKSQSDWLFWLTLSSLDTQFARVWRCLVNMPGILVSCITNTINWMNYWQQKFTPHCSGGWKSETGVQQHSRVLVSTLLWAADSWLLTVSSEESPANTPYLPKTLTPHTISWGVGFQNMNFGRDTSI